MQPSNPSLLLPVNQVAPVQTFTRHQDDIAERIIKVHGLAFALACRHGSAADIAEGRRLLKETICIALAWEFARGAEMHRRSAESNAQMDHIERDMAQESPHVS